MSLFDSLVAAVIKADSKVEPPTPPTPPTPPIPPTPPTPPIPPTPPTQPTPEFDYKAEYEKLVVQNANLQKQLSESQLANLNLLNMTPVNDTKSFSEIMRENEYHPLYNERRK